MTDFEARQPPFKTWRKRKRLNFIRMALKIIRTHTTVRVAAAVDRAAFEKREHPAILGHSAYTLCVMSCLQQIYEWTHSSGYADPIDYVFESGSGYGAETRRLMDALVRRSRMSSDYRAVSYAFARKRERLPLQAADILAYEASKSLANKIAGSPRPIRRSLNALLSVKHHTHLFDGPTLDAFLDGFGRVLSESRPEPGMASS